MRNRHWRLAFVGAIAIAAIAACVGDDPVAGPSPGGSDGGGAEAASGEDANGGVDAGADACASADMKSDPRNCGACLHDCVHGACADNTCQPWVVGAFDGGSPIGPDTDGNYVYFAIGGNVSRVQIDGGGQVQMTTGLAAQAFAKGPTGMLACGTLNGDAGVWALPAVPGGPPTRLHAVAACSGLAADGTTLWAGRVSTIDEITPGQISQHQLTPFTERLTGDIDVGGARLYWTNQNAGIWSAPKATMDASRAVLNTDPLNEPNGLAVMDRFAYVTARPAGAGGILVRVALDGGASTVLLTNLPQAGASQAVAHAPNGALYFAAGNTLYGYVPPP